MIHYDLYREGKPPRSVPYCGQYVLANTGLTKKWADVTCDRCHHEHAVYLQRQHEANVEHDNWRRQRMGKRKLSAGAQIIALWNELNDAERVLVYDVIRSQQPAKAKVKKEKKPKAMAAAAGADAGNETINS